MEPAVIRTFGTSNLEWEDWLERLRLSQKNHGVGMVVDVRSIPHSSRHPWFDGPTLRQSLNQAGFEYWYLGKSLGGRPRRISLYHPEGHAWFEKIQNTDIFQAALTKLINASRQLGSVLICGEEDPLECHRGLMIAPALAHRGVTVIHDRKGQRVETMPEFEDRLLRASGVDPAQGNLFDLPGQSHHLRSAYDLRSAYEWANRKNAFRFDPAFAVEP